MTCNDLKEKVQKIQPARVFFGFGCMLLVVGVVCLFCYAYGKLRGGGDLFKSFGLMGIPFIVIGGILVASLLSAYKKSGEYIDAYYECVKENK